MRRLSVLSLVFIVLLIPAVSAASEFELRPVITDQVSCASETVLYVFEIHNTGTSTESFTTRLSGSAAKWAVAAPAGSILAPGETESVYVYVTPSVFALGGDYNLNVDVSGQLTSSKQLKFNLEVSDCHSASLTASNDEIAVCAATPAIYSLDLENTGRFRENFELSLNGNGAKYATLSENLVPLDPGQSADVQVFANPVGDAVGTFTLSVTAKSQNSRAVSSDKLTLVSNACYDYDLSLDRNFVSSCENTETRVPITVRNTGTADNTYNVIVAGPRWAHAENSVMNVPAGQTRQTDLVLAPGFNVEGTFDVDVRIKDKLGETVSSQEVSAKIEACHTHSLKLDRTRDTLCPFTANTYEVSLVNSGKFPENYALEAIGADFAAIDRSFVELQPGQSTKLNLVVDPAGARSGKYKIKVEAESQGQLSSSSSEVLDLTIADLSACFGVQATSALTTVEVVAGEGALVPIIIENKGTETSSYNLEVSGSGATYAQLNPASVTLDGRKSETVYMYVAVPDQTPQANYKIAISARLEDGTVSSSTNVNIIVIPTKEIISATGPETPRDRVEQLVSSIKDRARAVRDSLVGDIAGAFAGIADRLPEVKQPMVEEELPEPEIVEETPEVVEEQPEEVIEEEPTEEEITTPVTNELPELPEVNLPRLPEISLPTLALPSISTPNIPSISQIKNFFIGSPTEIFNRIKEKRDARLTDEIKSTPRELPTQLPKDSLNISKLDVNSIVSKIKSKAKSLYDRAITFTKGETYDISNATWMGALLLIFLAITLLFSTGKKSNGEIVAPTPITPSPPTTRRNAWQRFVDFLEEDDEEKPEVTPVVETKPVEEPKVEEMKPEVKPKRTRRTTKKTTKRKTTRKKK